MKLEFRAWDKTQSYMAYQGTPDLETIQSFMFHFGDKPLMQYIGKSDIHGKKIYYGDIVKLPRCAVFDVADSIGVIKENEHGHSVIKTQRGYYHIGLVEFSEEVGNIYEDPELNPLTKLYTK